MKIYHTATREDYDALMIELDSQGYKWLSGAKMQKFNAFGMYREKAYEAHKDKTVLHTTLVGKDDVIEYKAKGENMIEKQFKQQSHDLVVNIASAIGTFATNLELSDDDLAKTQKLVKELSDSITEFIDSRKPKFKVGDYVVREYSDETYIGEVNDIKENHAVCCSYETVNDVICIDEIFNLENIRHATPEEIAEYKAALNFHKHGRKPFEVKKGDLLFNNERVRRFFVAYPSYWQKSKFISGDFSLLKTIEEVNEWLGADDERLNSSKEKA